MKIGILVTIVSGFGKKGFYHSQEVGLGKALNALGHDVTVYKCVARDQRLEDMQVGGRLRVRYLRVPAVGVHGYLRAEEIDPDLDGLLAFSDTQIFLPHVYRYCERHGICFVPYVGIAHSAQRNLKSRLMDLLYAAGTRRIYRRIPVLAKTEAVREELRAQGAAECAVAPVGLDESELKADYRSFDRRALRRKYGYGDGDVVVSFVGRLKVEKRPLDMIELFDGIRGRKPFQLLIVGEGYQRDEVAARVRERGLEPYVRMIERVPYEDMWEIHYIADYFVNLCRREIFGMALLEGIYYGSSAAAVEAPGPNYILRDLPGHRLCRSDAEIAEWLCGEQPDAATLDASARELMRRVSWQNCARACERRTLEYKRLNKLS